MIEPELPARLSLFGGVRSLLLWIGGALAGITALLYSCGYLITRAHLSMLGLHGLVSYGNDHFLQEGGKFFIAAGYEVLRTLLPLVAVLGAGALLLIALGRMTRDTRAGVALKATAGRWHERGRWRYAFIVVLYVALLLHADQYLTEFARPLAMANLLYADPSTRAGAKMGSTAELEAWLLAGEERKLAACFESLLLGTLLSAMLAWAAWRSSLPWRLRGWVLAPFVVSLGLYVLTLPMAYGALQRPVLYALVSFAPEEGKTAAGRLFLLDKSNDAFVVWDATARRVVWLPANDVKRAEIRGVEALFGVKGASK